MMSKFFMNGCHGGGIQLAVNDLLLPLHALNTETITVYLKMLPIIVFGDTDRKSHFKKADIKI